MSDGGSHDLLERIRRIATSVAGDPAVSSDTKTGDSGSIFEVAARSLSTSIEHWRRFPSVRRFLGGVQRDVLTSAGEPVELAARLGMSARLGTVARFFVDDRAVADVPIGPRGEVRRVISAPEPGLHRVDVRVFDDRGRLGSELVGHRMLQVSGGAPVALVHADLLVGPDAQDPSRATLVHQAISRLVEGGLEIAYFDIHEKNREAAIREALDVGAFHPAALLLFAAEENELRSLGVDFLQMFVSTAIRRLRGKGVPVTTILTGRSDDTRHGDRPEGVGVYTPEEVLGRRRARGFSAEREQARAFCEARTATSRLDWRLDQVTQSRLVHDNTMVAEFDNAAARRRLLEVVRRARKGIDLQFYIVRPSTFAERLVVELISRARTGVQVRFMVDALYSDQDVLGRVNPLVASLQAEPNVEVVALHPIEASTALEVSSFKQRDHRKLVIADGCVAFVSGRNAADEYYLGFDEVPVHDNTPHERIPWLDAHIEARGPLVAHLQAMFSDTWSAGGGRTSAVTPAGPPEGAAGTMSARLVVHRGLRDTNGLAMYETLFDLAEEHVYIVNDFPIVPALDQAIQRMLARGVRVRWLTGSATARRQDGSFFSAPLHRTLFEYMVKAKIEPLMEAGVEVYEFMPPPSPLVVCRGGRLRPYVHAKVVSVDGRVTSIGSANLDATASFWESEANLVVQDSGFAEGVEAVLQRFIEGSWRLDPQSEQWKRERTHRAVVAKLWPGTLYS